MSQAVGSSKSKSHDVAKLVDIYVYGIDDERYVAVYYFELSNGKRFKIRKTFHHEKAIKTEVIEED